MCPDHVRITLLFFLFSQSFVCAHSPIALYGGRPGQRVKDRSKASVFPFSIGPFFIPCFWLVIVPTLVQTFKPDLKESQALPCGQVWTASASRSFPSRSHIVSPSLTSHFSFPLLIEQRWNVGVCSNSFEKFRNTDILILQAIRGGRFGQRLGP